MILRCGLLILFLNCMRTTESVFDNGVIDNNELNRKFSYWPSVHNGANLFKFRKREAQGTIGQSEGGKITNLELAQSPAITQQNIQKENSIQRKNETKDNPINTKVNNSSHTDKISNDQVAPESINIGSNNASLSNATGELNINSTRKQIQDVEVKVNNTENVNINQTNSNANSTSVDVSSQMDINKPGVVKRGLIVFGGFALLAGAYFIFYRSNNKKNEAASSNLNDGNQFRYGVLQSEDRRDNLELSRVPLTMESDDDDEEDLDVFDLEDKKKSLSYVNLHTNDEEAVFGFEKDDDKDNLLLDIEEGPSDTLINWSSSGNNKSIL